MGLSLFSHLGECDIPAASEPIRKKRGIFQSDSLSLLWFCLALIPLSTLLEDSGLGFRLPRESISIAVIG